MAHLQGTCCQKAAADVPERRGSPSARARGASAACSTPALRYIIAGQSANRQIILACRLRAAGATGCHTLKEGRLSAALGTALCLLACWWAPSITAQHQSLCCKPCKLPASRSQKRTFTPRQKDWQPDSGLQKSTLVAQTRTGARRSAPARPPRSTAVRHCKAPRQQHCEPFVRSSRHGIIPPSKDTLPPHFSFLASAG